MESSQVYINGLKIKIVKGMYKRMIFGIKKEEDLLITAWVNPKYFMYMVEANVKDSGKSQIYGNTKQIVVAWVGGSTKSGYCVWWD